MPRTSTITMSDYGQLKETLWYACVITAAKLLRKTDTLTVTFELTGPRQEGRQVTVNLPTALLPNNRTASLFKAAGFTLNIGDSVQPGQLVGRHLRARFRPSSHGYEAVAFKPLKNDEQIPDATKQSSETPE